MEIFHDEKYFRLLKYIDGNGGTFHTNQLPREIMIWFNEDRTGISDALYTLKRAGYLDFINENTYSINIAGKEAVLKIQYKKEQEAHQDELNNKLVYYQANLAKEMYDDYPYTKKKANIAIVISIVAVLVTFLDLICKR